MPLSSFIPSSLIPKALNNVCNQLTLNIQYLHSLLEGRQGPFFLALMRYSNKLTSKAGFPPFSLLFSPSSGGSGTVSKLTQAMCKASLNREESLRFPLLNTTAPQTQRHPRSTPPSMPNSGLNLNALILPSRQHSPLHPLTLFRSPAGSSTSRIFFWLCLPPGSIGEGLAIILQSLYRPWFPTGSPWPTGLALFQIKLTRIPQKSCLSRLLLSVRPSFFISTACPIKVI